MALYVFKWGGGEERKPPTCVIKGQVVNGLQISFQATQAELTVEKISKAVFLFYPL